MNPDGNITTLRPRTSGPIPLAGGDLALYELQKPMVEPLLRIFRLTNTALDVLFYGQRGRVHGRHVHPRDGGRYRNGQQFRRRPQSIVESLRPECVEQPRRVDPGDRRESAAICRAVRRHGGIPALRQWACGRTAAQCLHNGRRKLGAGRGGLCLECFARARRAGRRDRSGLRSRRCGAAGARRLVRLRTARLAAIDHAGLFGRRGSESRANGAPAGPQLTASKARAASGAPVFEHGSAASDDLHGVLQDARRITRVIGHSKGALAIENALRSLPPERTGDISVATFGCVIAEEQKHCGYAQFLGILDTACRGDQFMGPSA